MDSNEKAFKSSVSEIAGIFGNGVNFPATYTGCIEVMKSVKSLDSQLRSSVAKECIHRVCEWTNCKSLKKRKIDKRVGECVSKIPNVEHSGTSVFLNITVQEVKLTTRDTDEVICKHDMSNISFAGGSDCESNSYVAYIAKDRNSWRACYVIDCGLDKSASVMRVLGQAFEMQSIKNGDLFRSYSSLSLPRIESPRCYTKSYSHNIQSAEKSPDATNSSNHNFGGVKKDERVYSNLSLDVKPWQQCFKSTRKCSLGMIGICEEASNMEIPTPSAPPPDEPSSKQSFGTSDFAVPPEVHQSVLKHENWFHGKLDRDQAEDLLQDDGDFLVRESSGTADNYVLTCQSLDEPRHLLLIDEQGVVRTIDRVFDNIPHLVNYHYSHSLPIMSQDCPIFLKTPVVPNANK